MLGGPGQWAAVAYQEEWFWEGKVVDCTLHIKGEGLTVHVLLAGVNTGSAAGDAVELLAQEVGVAVVAGVLLDHVQVDQAQ